MPGLDEEREPQNALVDGVQAPPSGRWRRTARCHPRTVSWPGSFRVGPTALRRCPQGRRRARSRLILAAAAGRAQEERPRFLPPPQSRHVHQFATWKDEIAGVVGTALRC
jgi:hypothetical protein